MRSSFINGCAALALLVMVAGAWSSPASAADKNAAKGGEHAGGKSVVPFYSRGEVKKQAADMKAKADQILNEQIAKIKLNPEKDEVEQMFEGSISLARHLADIQELSEMFMQCEADMQNAIREKLDSGTATKADKAQFKKCTQHCDKIDAKLHEMHRKTRMLTSATRQKYILDGWNKHTKMMEEIRDMLKECEPMFASTMACCKNPGDSAAHKHDQ